MLQTKSSYNIVILAFVILVAAVAFRYTTLSADTPEDLTWSAGLYVDEGYKTLTPRNMLLFGKRSWHESDTYGGWLDSSPVTQWSVYAAFKIFGITIESARLVPLAFFTLFLLLYIFLYRKRYAQAIIITGLILLSTDITLFTFSRIMLLEMPMSFFLYGIILPIALFYEKRPASFVPVLLFIIGGIIVAKTIKYSGLLYILPAVFSAALFFIINNTFFSRKQIIGILGATCIMLLAALGYTHEIWGPRINLDPVRYLYRVIDNPLLNTSPIVFVCATLCGALALLYQPEQYLKNLYRLTLLSIVLLTPLLLALFAYSPMRYYAPIIPACILLILEWTSDLKHNNQSTTRQTATIFFSTAVLSLAVAQGLAALDVHETVSVRYLLPPSIAVAVIIIKFRTVLLTATTTRTLTYGLIAGAIIHNSIFLLNFATNQTHDAANMRNKLTSIVDKSETVAGGWAPFLTLGTDIRSLYANTEFNRPETLKIIQPDYFLLSETPTAMRTLNMIERDPEIYVGTPIPLGKYHKTNVRLYPLDFKKTEKQAIPTTDLTPPQRDNGQN